MQHTQPNRIINFLSTITAFMITLWAIFLVLYVILLVMSLFEQSSVSYSVDWPVFFSDQMLASFNANHSGFLSRPHDSDFGGLSHLSALLGPRDTQWPGYALFKNSALILELSLYIGIVYLFHRIILDVKRQRPFNLINIKRLKHMALLLFLLVPFAMIETMIHHWYIINHVEMNNVEFISRLFNSDTHAQSFLTENQVLLSNKRDFSPILYSLVMYVIALVFQEGLIIRQDSESIV